MCGGNYQNKIKVLSKVDRLLRASVSWPYAGERNHHVQDKNRTITRFATQVKQGYYGYRRQVAAEAVSTALTAIGEAGTVDTGVNPLKITSSNHFLHQIKIMLDGRKKENPPTIKKLPIEVNIL